jgi:hypothetical protein
MKVSEDAVDLTYDVENHSVNKEAIVFKLELGSYEDRIPTETLDKFLSIGSVKPLRVGNATKYLQGSYPSLEEAEKALENIKSQGFEKAKVVGDFNGKIISAQEARLLKNHGEAVSSN